MYHKDPTPMKLFQELIDEIIDHLSTNLDLNSASLIGKAWTRRSQQKLFKRVILTPSDLMPWFCRTEETAAAMAPWITEVELRGDTWGSVPWAKPSTLARFMESLASSPIQHLTITPFNMERLENTSLVRCFEPIAEPLRSLKLRYLKTCAPALTFLVSLFPNLDDILLEWANAKPMSWTCGEHDSKYIPSFSGTLEYLALLNGIRPAFLSWLMEHPLRFHTISPGMLTEDDIPAFSKLVEMCAPTLKDIPHIKFYAGKQ